MRSGGKLYFKSINEEVYMNEQTGSKWQKIGMIQLTFIFLAIRGGCIKFATGLNIIIGIIQKVYM